MNIWIAIFRPIHMITNISVLVVQSNLILSSNLTISYIWNCPAAIATSLVEKTEDKIISKS